MRRVLSLTAAVSILAAAPILAGWEEGVAAFSTKKYDQAVQEFQTVVQQSPEGYQGYYMLGLSLEQLKRKEEALHNLTKAYEINPNEPQVQLALGRAYRNVRRYDHAAKLLANVDAGKLPTGQQAALYQLRGEARFKSGSAESALRDFEQLAKLRPSDADIQYLYGTTALSVDRLDQGISALAKASELAPKDTEKQRIYATALVKQGRMSRDKVQKKAAYKKAAQVAARLAAQEPTYDNLMLQVSAELGAGLYEQAATTGQAAAQKNSGDWLAYYYVGQAHTSAGNFAAAEGPLREALAKAKNPDDQRKVWRQLGFSYEKQKQYAQSIEAYEKAGDQAAVARVRQNEETAQYNKKVEQENAQIREMEEEARRLEEELKKIEEESGKQ